MSANIRTERDGAVLVVTLNRPDKKNALTAEMYEALSAALKSASADDGVAVVLIRGEGGVFSAGNDITDFALRAAGGASVETSAGADFIRALARFEKPLVAAVDGNAVGIGATLCFHCDLVYASHSAKFSMPFVDLGLVPEAGSSRLAVERFGYARAAQYLLLGESFDADTAVEIGLVNEVVAHGALQGYALEKARALALKPRGALIVTRRLMRGEAESLYAHMEVELRAFAEAVRSPEARAAFMAFLARPKG